MSLDSLDFFPRLSDNLCSLLEYAEDYDVIIRVGIENNRLEKLGGGDILELLVAADELILEELIYPLQEFLLKHKQKWIQDNILYVLNTVIERNACSKLRSHCLSIVCPEPQRYFDSKEFMDLDETTLVSLLSRDDLCMEEGKIWDYLISWGLTNTFNIKSNHIFKWSTKEFCALEKTLQRCIPLIRFWQLPLEDFNNKVRPFAEILPRNLKLRLLLSPGTSPSEMSPILSSNIFYLSNYISSLSNHFITNQTNGQTLSPPISPSVIPLSLPERTIDSTIITHQQAALIACWIDRKSVSESTPQIDLFPIPYIFRDVEWRGTRDSFIFSLTNPYCDAHRSNNNVISKSKISRIKKDGINEAIQLHDRLGPSFGFYELKIIDNAHQGTSSYASG
ncbi:6882_t:CDS:2, partial [Funneliformis mosseae]